MPPNIAPGNDAGRPARSGPRSTSAGEGPDTAHDSARGGQPQAENDAQSRPEHADSQAWSDLLADPWRVVLVESEADADTLRPAYSTVGIEVASIGDVGLPELVRDQVVLVLDRAARHAGDLRQLGAAEVWECWSPPPWRGVAEWAENSIQQGATSGDELLELVRAMTGTARMSTAEPTGHPGMAKPAEAPAAPVSSITTTWARVEAGTLSRTPRPRRWLLRHPTKDGGPCPPGEGDGLLPLGKCGMLTAAGGTGKSMAVLQLALSVVTGRPWLGHFVVDRKVAGDVLLIMAEEDVEELHRRLFDVAEAMGLSPSEREEAERRIVALPLAGEDVGLLAVNQSRRIAPTIHHAALIERATATAGPDGWALVVLDPLSRFAGVPIDLDNSMATKVVQAVEALVRLPGSPTVIVVHHSSKDSRRNGTADARGATGITDGLRWVSALVAEDGGRLRLELQKSNYSRPCSPVVLERAAGGVLRAVGLADQSRADTAKAEQELEDRAAIMRSLRAVGSSTSIDAIVTGAGLRAQRGRALVRRLIDEGEIDVRGTPKRPVYVPAAEEDEDAGTGGGENSPYPTGRRTSSALVARNGVQNVPDGDGTARTSGGAA